MRIQTPQGTFDLGPVYQRTPEGDLHDAVVTLPDGSTRHQAIFRPTLVKREQTIRNRFARLPEQDLTPQKVAT